MSDIEHSESDDQEAKNDICPGEQLELARKAKKFKIEDVAIKLKLPAEKIRAMEQCEVERIGEPVFVAGYLRAYARLLDLSADDIVRDYEKQTLFMSTSSANVDIKPLVGDLGHITNILSSKVLSRKTSRGRSIIIMLLLLIVLPVVGYVMWNDEPENNLNTTNVNTTNVNITNVNKIADESLRINSDIRNISDVERVSVAPPSSDEEVMVDASIPALAVVEPELTVTEELKSELELTFKEDSWVEVNDARGERLLFRLARAGMARIVTGVAPFKIELGHVSAVDILYNGKLYDMSRFEGRRFARFQVGDAGDSMDNG